jgi:hypothetical protein
VRAAGAGDRRAKRRELAAAAEDGPEDDEELNNLVAEVQADEAAQAGISPPAHRCFRTHNNLTIYTPMYVTHPLCCLTLYIPIIYAPMYVTHPLCCLTLYIGA